MTEDQVRDEARVILKMENKKDVKSGVGQLTTFNQLGFKGILDKPDGWYLLKNKAEVVVVLEIKSSKTHLKGHLIEELCSQTKRFESDKKTS